MIRALRRARTFASALVAFTFALNSCTEIVAPPATAIPFSPPANFALWWKVAEQCSGLSRPFESVKWAIIPGVSSFSDGAGDDNLAGAWYSPEQEIVLAARDTSRGDEVRHEMLHALLRERAGHPREFFYDKCGGYVSCVSGCATQAGIDSTPIPSAILVDRRALEYQLSVAPETVSISKGGGGAAYVAAISIRNPFSYPVRVPLALVPGDCCASVTLGIIPPRPEYANWVWTLGGSIDLRPGETRRYVNDGDAQQLALSPGAHSISGFFNIDTLAAIPFWVEP